MKVWVRQVCRALGLVVALAAATAAAPVVFASSDPFVDALPVGGTGVGFVWKSEHSVYRGDQGGLDNLPLYLYEGERAYLHGTRLGLKFRQEDWRFDAFLRYRFDGFTRDRRPESAVALGIEAREPGWDAGASVRREFSWGTPYVELLHDVSNASDGTELRAGYWNQARYGRLTLKPHLMAAWRSESLNNFYFGTSAYQAGAGLDLQAALYASYALTESWNLIGGVSATRRSSEITSSPLARPGLQSEVFAGFLYDFSPKQARWAPLSSPGGKPLIVKALYGNSSDCDMLQIMRLNCTTRHTVDNTDIWAVHVGRMLIDTPDGWPVQLAGFIGAQRHLEKAYQDDFWSVMAFFKAYWYGFPWDKYVRTRIGFGSGLSYAEQIPFMELRDQAKHERGNWKLLNYLDPSIDFRVGRDTYLGLGVSHRSGEFGKSQFFGNVNGGSNYIYVSIETTLR